MNKKTVTKTTKQEVCFDEQLLTNHLDDYQDLSQLSLHQEIMVHAYKLNGWLYRSWNNPMVIDIQEDYLVLCSTNSLVITSEEYSTRNFPSYTTKTSYWFFFKKEWFNIIATIEKTGMKLYINIASPFIFEEQAIKYYDFDLDFKINAEKQWREVDFDEFLENSKKYRYPKQLVQKIMQVESQIEQLIQDRYFDRLISKNKIIELNNLVPTKKTVRYKRNETPARFKKVNYGPKEN
ncbi:DUF402 domain-containing protein [Ureaplasma miroungigenitalium]|uniref:DUF402 domain-containing protein n=1 Tax=Ureaplasma miroungigenitalium TaxID=1042321 RepID=A0ABT3BLT2_9BACT|nr:DUF402 domain-containing protein [Ureaplasma miroungigenitalium]MCV3728218.1 DUF402 domain-containing protein [Ureaplasma miroungigenitalium]MCV3734022.1 DUF402 domain-containing protein [Ureaplasma miroungigenitalium]